MLVPCPVILFCIIFNRDKFLYKNTSLILGQSSTYKPYSEYIQLLLIVTINSWVIIFTCKHMVSHLETARFDPGTLEIS